MAVKADFETRSLQHEEEHPPAQIVLKHCAVVRRLKTARKCALQISKGPAFRSKSEREQEDAISHMDEHAIQVHNKFMTLVSDLIDGTQDSSVYEDACRHLLGAPSLFHTTLKPQFFLFPRGIRCDVMEDSALADAKTSWECLLGSTWVPCLADLPVDNGCLRIISWHGL